MADLTGWWLWQSHSWGSSDPALPRATTKRVLKEWHSHICMEERTKFSTNFAHAHLQSWQHHLVRVICRIFFLAIWSIVKRKVKDCGMFLRPSACMWKPTPLWRHGRKISLFQHILIDGMDERVYYSFVYVCVWESVQICNSYACSTCGQSLSTGCPPQSWQNFI